MKTASSSVIAYLNALRTDPDAIAIVADCYTIWLLDGMVLTYTNADLPITLNGLVYLANSVLIDGLRYKCSVGFDVDQQQITISATTGDTVGGNPILQAIGEGVFDGAEIQRERVFLNSWSSTDRADPVGSVILFKGRVGKIDKIGRASAEITVNSDLVLLDLQMPRNIYSPACQHVLYDSGCTMIKSAYAANGTVGAGSMAALINWTGATANFVQGTILFTSGANSGVTANVKSAVPGTSLTLSYPLPETPSAGDAFTAYWGCDHTQATCVNRFDNFVNFRGHPYVPLPSFTLY